MFKRKNVVLTANRQPRHTEERSAPTQAHPGIRPSLVNSRPVTSTSSRTLDRALAHGGVPVGTVTLIEEHGTTDFASSLLKSLSTLAVCEARDGAKSHVVCVGIQDWLRALPSKAKDRKPSSSQTSRQNERMKIAWRYAKYAEQADDVSVASLYCIDVDFKTTMLPAPQADEVSYVSGASLNELLSRLQSTLKSLPSYTLVRIVIPSLLHPALYSSQNCDPKLLLPFFHRLRQLTSSHGNAVAFVSMSLKLYPRTQSVMAGVELLVDNCIEIEPFDSADENIQGFLHINRISVLSDRGDMVEQRRELSFKLGRRQFEVSPFAIPVEDMNDSEVNTAESW